MTNRCFFKIKYVKKSFRNNKLDTSLKDMLMASHLCSCVKHYNMCDLFILILHLSGIQRCLDKSGLMYTAIKTMSESFFYITS